MKKSVQDQFPFSIKDHIRKEGLGQNDFKGKKRTISVECERKAVRICIPQPRPTNKKRHQMGD